MKGQFLSEAYGIITLKIHRISFTWSKLGVMSHGQVWANGCKSRYPGLSPSWPDTRQFWSWSHIPHVPTHTVDCDSVWVPRVLTNKPSLLLFTKLYRCHSKVLTATGEGVINTPLTGSKLLFWPQNKQTKLLLTFLGVLFLMDSTSKGKSSRLAWPGIRRRLHVKGEERAPVLSNLKHFLPCQDDPGSCRREIMCGESVPKPSQVWIWHQQNASTSVQSFNNQMQEGLKGRVDGALRNLV